MCIFCKIAKGEAPSYCIYEDNNVIAFLDKKPANIGHTLVIPKKHYTNIFDLDKETGKIIFDVVMDLAKHICKQLSIESVNIINNSGIRSGQTINHFHFHIIPRSKYDRFSIHSENLNLNPDQLSLLQDKLYQK